MSSRADLTIYQGDDYGAEVSVLNVDGTPTDLTGCTAAAQIRAGVAERSPEALLTITTVVGPANKVGLSILKTETAKLVRPQYFWDLQLTFPSTSRVTVLHGQVRVKQEVTR
jgi:hypothetical protein